MLTFFTYYFAIGLIWTKFMEWFVQNHSPTKKKFTPGQILYNILLWWLVIIITFILVYTESKDSNV